MTDLILDNKLLDDMILWKKAKEEETNQSIKIRKVLPSVIEKCSECPYCHTREIVKQAYSYTSTTCCLAPTTVKTFWNGIPDNCPLPNEPFKYTCK